MAWTAIMRRHVITGMPSIAKLPGGFIMDFNDKDRFLEERFDRYNNWISEGKIPSSSRVIPIHESINSLQWVLPTNQVIEILRNTRSFALQNCSCRTKYQRCNKPIEVCFLINDAADTAIENGEAKHINLDEAVNRLKIANEHGLVHLTIYNPDQHVFALCSCCDCCCHDLQIMKQYQSPQFIAHSDYIAEVDFKMLKLW